jgi:MoaA/NifB/PqqE/SkfB family radical SAM enzyme
MYNSNRKDTGLMSMDGFKRAIDLSAAYLKKRRFTAILQHRGESFLHPDFYEMLDYACAQGIRIGGIHTSLSVELDIDRFMKSPLPFILVNMGGISKDIHEKVMRGSNFQLVVDNLRAILREIRTSGSKKEVFLKINPTKHNISQSDEIAGFFAGLGGKRNNASLGRTSFFLPHEASPEEIEEFFANIVSEEVQPYLTFTFDEKKYIRPKSSGCLMMGPAVLWDGRVTLCYQDQLGAIHLGNAFTDSLEDIFKNKATRSMVMNGYKRRLPVCRGCN